MFSGLGERYICPSPDSTKLLGESREIAEATHLSVSTVGSTRMSSILDGGLPTYWEGRRGRHSVDCSYGPSSGKVMFPRQEKGFQPFNGTNQCSRLSHSHGEKQRSDKASRKR